MTNEQQYFIQILKDYIHQKPSQKNEDIDIDVVSNYAIIHQLGAILFQQCSKYYPLLECKPQYTATIHGYINRQNAVNEIEKALTDNNIKYFILKGPFVADYYPQPAFRTMGDTDIVVDDCEKVDSLLTELGFETIDRHPNRESTYRKNELDFEIHSKLVYKEAINEKVQFDYFNDFWKYVENNKIDDTFHFLYLLLHLRKHLMNSGIGIRQFLDIAVIIKNNNNIDWTILETELPKLKMYDFSRSVFGFVEKWFDVKSPISPLFPDESFAEEVEGIVFKNGVFGFDNEDNDNYLSSNVAINSRFRKTSLLLHSIKKFNLFPAYRNMIKLDYCSKLNGKPILLPYYWSKRIIFLSTKKEKFQESKKILNTNMNMDDYINKREQFFKRWGL